MEGHCRGWRDCAWCLAIFIRVGVVQCCDLLSTSLVLLPASHHALRPVVLLQEETERRLCQHHLLLHDGAGRLC